jgi:3-phenylpropionate/cinnamic acid dioxygenase small subunit
VLKVLRALVIVHGDTPRTKHVTTNLVVDVDENEGAASARAYFTVFQATEKLPLQAIVAGRYEDRFTRVGGRWRFNERAIHMDLQGDLSQHLRR